MTTAREQRHRSLYAEEAQARLTRIADAALAMEADLRRAQPPDPGLVEGMLREAHTISSGAAVVGFTHVGDAARALEDALEALRGERQPGAGPVVDTLLAAVDGLRVLIAAAVRDEEHAALTARIRGRRHASAPEPEAPAPSAPLPHAAAVPLTRAPSDATSSSRGAPALLQCLIVAAGEGRYALPLTGVALALPSSDAAVRSASPPAAGADTETLSRSDLATVLGIAALPAGRSPERPVVVVRRPQRRHAFTVDELCGLHGLVVQDLSPLLPRLDCVSGTAVDPDGRLVVVLDPAGLVDLVARPESAPAVEPEPARRSPARVLVVDDNRVAREVQRSVLAGAGHHVTTAASGAEALAAIRRSPPDLLLAEVAMPGMDGLDLTRAVRADPDLAGLPVVLLTSRAGPGDREAGLEAGADAYLGTRSADVVGLRAAVAELLERRAGTRPAQSAQRPWKRRS